MNETENKIELEEIQEDNDKPNQTKIGNTNVTVSFSQNNISLMQLLEEYLYTI